MITAQLAVIIRILRNFGQSCHRLCHIVCRKYFPPHTFKMDALYCVKSRGLVKTNAHLSLCLNLNKRQFATNMK